MLDVQIVAQAKLNMIELKLNPKNPRTISKDAFERLKQSIRDLPQMLQERPIKYDENKVILGGNMRYKALQDLEKEGFEIKDEYFSQATTLTTEDQKREFVIKDNAPAGISSDWDQDVLANDWSDDPLEEWGMEGLDWRTEEIIEDEAPEVGDEPAVSKLGEIYQLGRHRVMCGDSTQIADVGKLMSEQRADLLLTDPPYNVEYVGKTKDALTIQNDKMEDGGFLQFLIDAFKTMFMFAKEGAGFYIWHADSEGYNFRNACKQVGLTVRQCLIWNKNSMVMGRQDYQWKHEPCLYGWKDGSSHSWYSDRKQTTIIDFDRPSRSEQHPTMKPVGLMAYLINNSSKSGDIVLDTFLGSGSTLIACEQTNRICYGMELDEKYVDVIRKRYHKFVTGNEDGWEDATPVID